MSTNTLSPKEARERLKELDKEIERRELETKIQSFKLGDYEPLDLNPKQLEALNILTDKETEHLVFGGGAGGGKTYLGCIWQAFSCMAYEDVRYFVARKTLKIAKRTVLKSFFKLAKLHNLVKDVDYTWQEQKAVIYFPKTESEIQLLEVKFNPSDPLFEDLGSEEFTGGWFEEGGEIVFGAFDTGKTRVGRQNNDLHGLAPKILTTCNPKKNWLYRTVYKPFVEGVLEKTTKFIQSLVGDNPKIDSNYAKNLGAIKDPVKRQRLKDGIWEYDDSEDSLITYEEIQGIFQNTVAEPSTKRFITCDVARLGKDLTVIFVWQGFTIIDITTFEKNTITECVKKIDELSRRHKVQNKNIIIDESGLGGGVVDAFHGVRGFVANSKVLNGENYDNLKSQCGFYLADYIKKKDIKCQCNESQKDTITNELEQLRQKNIHKDGKNALVPKDEMKAKLGGKSPDYLDNFIMRMLPELVNIDLGTINYYDDASLDMYRNNPYLR